MTRLAIASLVLALGVASCKSGGGAEQRTDIIAKMSSTKGPLDTCYANALARNRKLAGMFVIEFIADGDTGQFKNVIVRRDEPQDPILRLCVINEVIKLKLAKAPGSSVQINFPYKFRPLN
jgi:hypothetical protein